jgi:beta-glucosidase
LIPTPYNKTGNLIGPFGESSWLNVYPTGFKSLLLWIDARYNHTKLYCFENGVSVPKENDLPISEAIHDDFRINNYKTYLRAMNEAMKAGVNLHGYFSWSLLDNFEWSDGYSVRFGMVYVDYQNNQKRYIKDSAIWYSSYIKNQT